MKLKDKVVIVTASTRGIGLAVTESCAKEGAVVYMAARNLERAEKEATRLNNAGFKVRCVYNDASVPESYASMAEEVAKNEGRIDVLVNNFGTSDPKRDLDLASTDANVFIDTVTLNLRSVFMASKAVLGYMKNGGSIINISSVGGNVPDISQIAYGTSKAAINYLTKLIAVHEAKHKIRCNAVLPGSPIRPRGICFKNSVRKSSDKFSLTASVAVIPGSTALHLIWCFASCTAINFVK